MEVIGVQFHKSSRIEYFDPRGEVLEKGQGVLVEVEEGSRYGVVVFSNLDIPDEYLAPDIRPIIRPAVEGDIEEKNRRMAEEALLICQEKIHNHQLDMHLVDAEYTEDRSKLIFYFTADQRVDFRNLVRDLAQTFRTRIELRQIGVRDKARMVGGIGACGQELCCARYLKDFAPVSIKMAKLQGLSLNPSKISGVCGRLMCCLNYETELYQENSRDIPPNGTLVLTEEGQGYVVDRDILQQRVRIHLYKEDNTEDEKYFRLNDVEILVRRKKGSPKPPLIDDLSQHHFVTEGEKKVVREVEATIQEQEGEGKEKLAIAEDLIQQAKKKKILNPDSRLSGAELKVAAQAMEETDVRRQNWIERQEEKKGQRSNPTHKKKSNFQPGHVHQMASGAKAGSPSSDKSVSYSEPYGMKGKSYRKHGSRRKSGRGRKK